MDLTWLIDYLCALPGTQRDFKAEWGFDRFRIHEKMFAAICTPGEEHKSFAGHTLINLKCDPRLAEALRAEYPHIVPGFYCDKRCWNSILLDGDVPQEVVLDLCKMSYELVLAKLPKKVQWEIAAGNPAAEKGE